MLVLVVRLVLVLRHVVVVVHPVVVSEIDFKLHTDVLGTDFVGA